MRQKEKFRALDRLRDYERLQAHNKKVLEYELTNIDYSRDTSMEKPVPSTTKHSFIRSTSPDSRYNPYHVSNRIVILPQNNLLYR